ncbi:MAG: very short patch repair endonuclease [Clostridiales bacterium]|nr:very short patch repair endonuclease [Clostridiales bacterium]
MSDVFSTEKRSEIMKSVKSRNTRTTELKLISIFKELHIIGWRRTYPLVGKPDFVFPKKRIVVFVDGCFWHGHDCRNVTPSANAEFWNAKRDYNKRHDTVVTETLENKNWMVIRIWECELKKKNVELLKAKLLPLLEN